MNGNQCPHFGDCERKKGLLPFHMIKHFRSRQLSSVFGLVASLVAHAEVEVSFNHSYSGAAGGFQNAGVITLAFTVDGSGEVVLDASCVQAAPTTYVDDFDGAVGTVSDPAMFGQSFSITLSRSLNPATLRIDNSGNGLAVQGQNPQRIDAATEVIDFSITGADSDFLLKNVSFAKATTSAGTELDVITTSYPLSAATGTIDVSTQGVDGDFSISSASDANGQGFVLSGFGFDFSAPVTGVRFDNDSGDEKWTTAENWDPDGVPVSPADTQIDGADVILDSVLVDGPSKLDLKKGTLTLRGVSNLPVDAMVVGRQLELEARLIMEGSGVSINYSGSGAGTFAVGSAGTVVSLPDAGGSGVFELGSGELILDLGSEWIMDGSDYTGPTTPGTRFVLANYGTFSGSTMGLRTRNFDLPANRKLELVAEADSVYYEIKVQTAASGPNMIIINIDDIVGGQHFGFEGRDCLTPTIDSLASNGIRFTEAFAASTVCGPSRYALLSGRWPSRNTSANFLAKYPLGTLGRFGVSDTELEDDGENLGAWLQQAGYRTGFVGKSHVWDDDIKIKVNWAAKGLIQYSQTTDPALDPSVNGAMKHNHRVLCQRMRKVGFDYVSGFYAANLLELRNDYLNVHNQEWITKGALDFIEENHDQRFFLYIAPTINHGPVRNNLSKSLGADHRYTGEGYLPNPDFSFMPTRQEIRDEVRGAGKQLISARETWIDYSMAALKNKLIQHGVAEDTLIILTSDHGEKALNVTPIDWGKSSLNDLGMRVPLVMNWPNGISSEGRVYAELVSQVDFVPTLLELAGVSSLPTRPVDGVSLVPVLNGSSASLRDEVFCEIGYARAVRSKTSKYIALRYTQEIYDKISNGDHWPNFNTGLPTEPRPYYTNNSSLGYNVAKSNPGYFDDDQIYDLVNDPDEDQNIYESSPRKAYELKKKLGTYLEKIPGRPFRNFSNAEIEFSPAPGAVPAVPGTIQSQFLDLENIRFTWADTASNELGFVVEKSENGGDFEIVAEVPSGSTVKNIKIDRKVEDLIFRVSAYNTLGDSLGGALVDLLTPENWRYRNFADVDPMLDGELSQWSVDADEDGVATLWEYAFATNPREASSVEWPQLSTSQVGDDSFLNYSVPKMARRQVEIVGSVSLDVNIWNSGELHCPLVEEADDYLLFRSAIPISDSERQFIRAEIIQP